MKNFVQIGTNDGDDDFKQRCEQLVERSRIILIEPHIELKSTIESNWAHLLQKHDVTIVNKAIVPNKEIKSVDFYYQENNLVLSSVLDRRTYDLPQKKTVESIHIDLLLEEMGIYEIEELHIDTEGLDYEILLSINLDRTNIKNITCEIWPFEDDDKKESYKTGPQMRKNVRLKFTDYSISEITLDKMPTLKFEKNV